MSMPSVASWDYQGTDTYGSSAELQNIIILGKNTGDVVFCDAGFGLCAVQANQTLQDMELVEGVAEGITDGDGTGFAQGQVFGIGEFGEGTFVKGVEGVNADVVMLYYVLGPWDEHFGLHEGSYGLLGFLAFWLCLH